MKIFLLKYFNFDIRVSISKPGSGVKQALTNNEVDFGGCYHSMTHARYQFADFSYVYIFSRIRIYSIKPERGYVWYSFIKPYPYSVWILIILSIPVSGLVLYMLYLINEKEETRSLSNCMWDVCKIICWDSISITNPPISVCIHVGVYFLMTTVLVAAYLGLIT